MLDLRRLWRGAVRGEKVDGAVVDDVDREVRSATPTRIVGLICIPLTEKARPFQLRVWALRNRFMFDRWE